MTTLAIAPTVEAKRFLVQKLTGDSLINSAVAGQVLEGPLPADVTDPFIYLHLSREPEDLRVNGPIILWTTVYYHVVLCLSGTSLLSGTANLELLDQRISLLLNAQAGSTASAGGSAFIGECVRIGQARLLPLFVPATEQTYQQLGSEWKLTVQPLN